MNDTDEVITRANALYAAAMRESKPRQFGIAAMAGLSRPSQIRRVSHTRSWRDYLMQARRELRE